MAIDLSNMKVVSGSVQGTTANEEISNGDVIARVGTGASKAINTDESKKTVLGVAINNAPAGGLVFYLGTGAIIEDDNISNSGYDVTYWLGSTAGKLEEYDDVDVGEWAVLVGDAFKFKQRIRLSVVDYKIQKQSELPVDANPPGVVQNLSVDSLTMDSISISWSAPSESSQPVTSYNVQYKKDSGADFITFAGTGLATSVQLTGLDAGSTYLIRVRAVSSNGDGEWSEVSGDTVQAPSDQVTFVEVEELAAEDNKRGLIPYTLPRYAGARDGVFVVNGCIWSEDGENWTQCSTFGQSSVWELGAYIVKGMSSEGRMYMDSGGRTWSTTLKEWTTAYDGAFMPAQQQTQTFFWKGKFQVVGVSQSLKSGSPYQYMWSETSKFWEGGYQGSQSDAVPAEEQIQNCDVMQFGDSKPDGTEVLCLARDSDSTDGTPWSGNWVPVILVDNGGNGLDSFEPISGLASVAGEVVSIKYNEVADYWVAITRDRSFRSTPGNPAGGWTSRSLPSSKRWSPCSHNGGLWIAVSTEPGDSEYIFSPNGLDWYRGTTIGPCWTIEGDTDPDDIDAINWGKIIFNNFGTNGVTLFGFSQGDAPYSYYKQEEV